MIIDERLKCAAGMVTKSGISCDVGTDHAYLAVYLTENNISKSCIACDIADGPLEAARKTVAESRVADRINIIKSDGLDNVEPNGITDVIMCGMGGELIADIISHAEWLKNGINIIAQPMTRADWFRKWLYSNGFEICREEACRADRFVYTVMQIRYTGAVSEVDDYFATVGRLDISKDISKEYALEKTKRMKTAAEGMLKSTDKTDEGSRLMSLAQRIENDVNRGVNNG